MLRRWGLGKGRSKPGGLRGCEKRGRREGHEERQVLGAIGRCTMRVLRGNFTSLAAGPARDLVLILCPPACELGSGIQIRRASSRDVSFPDPVRLKDTGESWITGKVWSRTILPSETLEIIPRAELLGPRTDLFIIETIEKELHKSSRSIRFSRHSQPCRAGEHLPNDRRYQRPLQSSPQLRSSKVEGGELRWRTPRYGTIQSAGEK